MSGDLEEREVTISGVKVVFPCKPYPSQFGMMDRVIKGLERRQNCLLESPTGSGKSLALLCSALAWQNTQHLKVAKESMSASKKDGTCEVCQRKAEGSVKPNSVNQVSTSLSDQTEKESTNLLDGPGVDDDDDDFKIPTKYRTPNVGQNKSKKRGHVSISYEDEQSSSKESTSDNKCTCNTESSASSGKQNYFAEAGAPTHGFLLFLTPVQQHFIRTTGSSHHLTLSHSTKILDCSYLKDVPDDKSKVPKIYFGTRTHKQIAQIVRELRKTAYHDVRMVILASREYTCVHPEVIKQKNKSDGCRERLDVNGPGCTFNDKAKRVFLSQGQLQNELNSAWDLEELVHACKRKKACPYFVTRNIKDQADIVFCPYNYLIDPLVRKSMEINLKDQIVILDEAHNIEDCARDAASGQLSTSQITQTMQNLQEMMDANVKFSDHLVLKRMMENVMRFVDDNSGNLDQADYDTSYKVWSGYDMVARLKNIGLGPDTIDEYKACLDRISASDEDQQQNTMRNFRGLEIKLHSSSVKILELLLQILDYMYRDELKFVEDYRVAVMKSVEYVSRNTNDSWLGKNRRGKTREVVFTLNFWCMNPAVAFSDFNPCRNVVLSSGTLSPMNSFASELGVPFPVQLEANHVIKDEQVWVGSIGCGPSGSQLQAVYKNMETFTFQDELGNLVLEVCQKVPYGVLCFLPSYRALEKFTDRWKITRMWDKLALRKKVLVEPRAADREDFDHMMKLFYEVVKDPLNCFDEHDECTDISDRDGAIFFAVCRGKVSEGMDFADNNARAVITVGIPFPSIKDLQVKLKREYNDKYRTDRGLLSGNEWYEIQAFRALNQALGRCIRHRKDWGAIIIVDDRFVRQAGKYLKGLSKWMRNKVQTHEVFPRFLESVSSFTEKMKKEMPVINPDTSFIPSTPATPNVHRRSVYHNQAAASPSFTSPVNSQSSPNVASPQFNQNASPSFMSPPSQNVTSRFFMTPNGCSPNLANTPDRSQKLRSLLKGNGSPSTPTTDPKVPIVQASSISGVQLYNQLVSIMSSPGVPKDKPYCIILDKGTPAEQMFHVDPSKAAKSSSSMSTVAVTTTSPAQETATTTSASTGVDVAKGTGSFTYNNTTTSLIGIQSGAVGTSNQPNNDVMTVLATTTPGVPINTQLINVMNLPSVPKDKPYYIIFNKGCQDEQMFHIDPSKRIQANSATKTVSLLKNNIAGAEKYGTNTQTTPNKQTPNHAADPTKNTLKTFSVVSDPGRPLQEQLKEILSSPSLPKEEPYYIVFNKGQTNEQTMFIEPSKNGKKHLQENHKVSESNGSKLDGSTILIDEPEIKTPDLPDLDPTPAPAQGMLTTQQISQMAQTNKYLLFCDLPGIENETKNQQNLSDVQGNYKQLTTSPDLFENKVEDTSANDKSGKKPNSEPNDNKPNNTELETSRITSETKHPNVGVVNLNTETNTDTSKRKPIFRKATKYSGHEIKVVDSVKEELGKFLKSKQKNLDMELTEGETEVSAEVTDQSKSNLLESDQSKSSLLVNNKSDLNIELNNPSKSDKVNDDEELKTDTTKVNGAIEQQTQQQHPNKRLSRGKFDRSVIDKLKNIRRMSSDALKAISNEQKSDKPVENNVLQDITMKTVGVEKSNDNDTHSDEDFLNTRRKSGRKRLSTALSKSASKRQKGVEYENSTELAKENKNITPSQIKCTKCGSNLLKSAGFITEKNSPKFVKAINGKKSSDIVSGSLNSLDGTTLQIMSSTNSGTILDSHYIPEHMCCVQYLQCGKCVGKNLSVIGVRVVMAETQSEFKLGQIWLMSSVVKI